MILEHEIPNGSKLYFGRAARVKREIESVASSILDKNGFQEIVTPLFSYQQHLSIADEKRLIKVNDKNNNPISLRADSTIDVIRIIQKRLGRNTQHRKWFYIQPIFTYPTSEQNQIGAEFMGEKELSSVMKIATEILDKLEVKPLIQLSNIKIPKILVEMFDELSLDDFRHTNIDKFLNLEIEWLKKLVYLQHIHQLDEVLEVVPDPIKAELLKMKELAQDSSTKNTVLAPMYYAQMLYYDEVFFRIIDKNEVYARGGRYTNSEINSVGFAIYTDVLCEKIVSEDI